MRILLFFFFFVCASINAQTYTQFDVTMPFRGNPSRTNHEPDSNPNWFLPDGLGAKLGYGYQYKELIGIGAHSGLEWKYYDKLVTAPIYANLRLAPKVGEETRIVGQVGYGVAFAIGRGDLSGEYKRASIGLQAGDGRSLFIEWSQYGFPLNGLKRISSVSLGISLISF